MTKFFNKFKKPVFDPFLVHFHNFGGSFFFLGNLALSHTPSYRFLAPCQNLERTNDTISRKHQNIWKDGRMDRSYFTGPFCIPLATSNQMKAKENVSKLIINRINYHKKLVILSFPLKLGIAQYLANLKKTYL